MRRTERLFQIIQILRRRERAVTAQAMATELEVAVRTVYRDIAELQAQRVPIEGSAGIGYLLRDGYDLPPLMFGEDEIDALVMGARIVESWADPALARAAGDVLAKIAAVVPQGLRPRVMGMALAAPPSGRRPEPKVDVATLRRAVREQRKIEIDYLALDDTPSVRTLWPLSLAFFPPVWLLVAWCEMRVDFRSFRVDRIERLTVQDERYPQQKGRRLIDYLAAFGYRP